MLSRRKLCNRHFQPSNDPIEPNNRERKQVELLKTEAGPMRPDGNAAEKEVYLKDDFVMFGGLSTERRRAAARFATQADG